MKRVFIIAFMLLALNCRADNTWERTDATWDRVADLWSRVAVSASDLILEWLFVADASDTSGEGNDGTINVNTAITTKTNGLGGFATIGTGTVTVALSGTKTSYSFYAKTNDVWRFYEVNNGVEHIDLSAENFEPTNFYTVAGDNITVGGTDYEVNNFEVYSISNTTAQSVSNRLTYALDTGIYPSYLTPSLSSNVVFAMNYSGETEQDASTNSATVTATDTTAVDLGTVNGAMAFNDSSSKEVIADSGELDLTGDMTLFTWVNPDTTADNERILDKGDAYWLGVSNGLYKVVYGSMAVNAGSIDTSIWTTVSSTYDGTTLTLYKDGASVGTTTTGSAPSANATDLTIGSSGSGDYWDGNIDEPLIANDDTTATEHANLYTNSWHLFGQIEGITTNSWWSSVQAFYTFNVESSQDYSGNGNHGTDTDVTYDGASAVFNGGSSKILLDDIVMQTNQPFTIACWIYNDGFTDTYPVIVETDQSASAAHWKFGASDSSVYDDFYFGAQSGGWAVMNTDGAGMVLSTWIHTAIVFDGIDHTAVSSFTFYTNAVEVGLVSGAAVGAGEGTYIGSENIGTTYWDGKIDNVIIAKDYAMTLSEITALYTNYPHAGQ